MFFHKGLALGVCLVWLLSIHLIPAAAQPLSGPPADPQYKFSTPLPPGVAAPDKLETRLGALKFFGGNPDKASAQKLYDNFDFQNAVQAYLLGIPAVNQAFNRQAILALGPVNRTVPIWESLMDSRTLLGVGNDNTPYSWFWIDLRQGPLVIEVPPKVLGLVDDMWYRWVGDVGFTGPDQGQGGKYLFLPPGYQGEVPKGYWVLRPATYGNLVLWRSFLVGGDPRPGVEAVKKFTKIYPLTQAANPTRPSFVNMSGKPFSMVYPANYPTYWQLLHQVVQEEPTESLDQIQLGFFAAIGIQKGRPFAPDGRMQKILAEAAAVGDATARTIAYHSRHRQNYYYPGSYWQLPLVGGYRFQTQPGVLNLESHVLFFFVTTGVSPALEVKMVGKGSQYAWTCKDASGNPLDGGKSYLLRLPPNIPVKDFWSVTVYSNQTRSMVQTDQQYPSVSSQTRGLLVNPDGSVEVYFGPRPPAEKRNNWVQTLPGTSWNANLRLYGPLEPWFNRTWRPGEIEPQP